MFRVRGCLVKLLHSEILNENTKGSSRSKKKLGAKEQKFALNEFKLEYHQEEEKKRKGK